MRLMVPALRSAAMLLLGGGLAFAQLSTTPAPRATAGATASASATLPAGRARVIYSHGQIEINADNSSLDQILNEIARVTGMKITGSVTDARVFGKYGPGAPAEILKRLLDGTDVNMLLKETASGAPAELILTPQNGPATPPNPNAAQDAAAESVPEPAVDKPMTVSGSDGVQTVVRDINGNPVSEAAGASAPAAAPPPVETPAQIQQRTQQAQQAMQQGHQATHP